MSINLDWEKAMLRSQREVDLYTTTYMDSNPERQIDKLHSIMEEKWKMYEACGLE